MERDEQEEGSGADHNSGGQVDGTNTMDAPLRSVLLLCFIEEDGDVAGAAGDCQHSKSTKIQTPYPR
jgi:hypothetical protein